MATSKTPTTNDSSLAIETPRTCGKSPEEGVLDPSYSSVKGRLPAKPTQTSKYPVLLPKALPPRAVVVPIRKSIPSTLKLQRLCRVARCPLKHCTLRSHRSYDIRRSLEQDFIAVSDGSQRDVKNTSPTDATKIHSQPYSVLSILNGGVDGLPILPLGKLEQPSSRAHFHCFFGHLYDRLVRMHYPPPQTATGRLGHEQAKQRALEIGLRHPVYCLHYIATSQHQILFGRDSKLDKEATALLGRMMSLLRARLDTFDQSEYRHLLFVIFTIVTFEIATGRTKALVQHRNAFHHLIESNGGFYNMGIYMSLIANLDRIFSIFACLPPLYPPPKNQFARKPNVAPLVYGRWLDDPASLRLIGREVHQYCIDCCRLIEILEWEGITFDPRDAPLRPSENLYYFFFLREGLVYEYIRLQNIMRDEQTLAMCILLTAKIVDYTVLMDNYLRILPVLFANRVHKIITSDGSEIQWLDHGDALSWILFVLASMPSPWDGKLWAMKRLQQQLDLKYPHGSWPTDWRNCELSNVRAFVWCDSRLLSGFLEACRKLDTNMRPA